MNTLLRRITPLAALMSVFVALGAVTAFASATTEIDRADAMFDLQGAPRIVHCPGEDATSYTQYTATYVGGQADLSPAVPTDPVTGGLDHGLAGSVKLTTAKTTFNDLTGRGVLKGTFTLTEATPTATITVVKGTLTLVVQRDAAGGPVLGRGWLSANTLDSAGKKDGMVLANVDAQLDPGLTTIHGIYGEAAPALASGPVAPYSVETGLTFSC